MQFFVIFVYFFVELTTVVLL